MANTILFNDSWSFLKTKLGTSFNDIQSKTSEFSPVDLPHDWLIYNTNDLYENSIGWYKKTFTIDQTKDIITSICFGGIYMDSAIYINKQKVGEYKYGYTSFEFDISKFITLGENEIIVSVTHQAPNSRWYSGAGIYRNVYLKKSNLNHIVTNGVYIVPRKNNDNTWTITIETEFILDKNTDINDTIIKHELQEFNSSKSEIKLLTNENSKKDNSFINKQVLTITDPKIWDIENPNRYQLKTELLISNSFIRNIAVDSEENTIGFKTVEFSSDKGFILNGRKVRLNGVCEHHDLGALGAAYNTNAMRRKLMILKSMGVNALRTSHNMPDKDVMDLADELGIVVDAEAFDMWELPKTEFDYARFFKQHMPQDVKNWVMRDRNHPSLIMWSIGNEIYDTHADEKHGQEITKKLIAEVTKYDPEQNGKPTFGSNYMPWENTQKCADIIKVVGYNYAEKFYKEHHEKHPDWVIYGSETASTVQSRGIYHFPLSTSLLSDDDEQCSSLGNSTTSWGSKRPEANIIDDRDAEFSMGQFIWTGFDYIGEPTPYHTKNSYFGQIDTAGFPKDSYYIYKAAWTDCSKDPFVHIVPYWDFNEGQKIDVRVVSNAPKVSLFFNDELIGTKEINTKHGKEYSAYFPLDYKKGVLKAQAFDSKEKLIATDIQSSFEDSASIYLETDKTELKADGTDLAFITIMMKDKNGNIVQNARDRVNVTITGQGRLLGLDNGDSTDYDQYKGISRRLFNGKLLAIVASTTQSGNFSVTVSSKNKKDETIEFCTKPVDEKLLQGISANQKNQDTKAFTQVSAENDIPIRKIELNIIKGNTKLTKENPSCELEAKIYPENANDNELIWKAVTETAVDSNIAKIEIVKDSNSKKVIVTGIGDGRFNTRCMSKNNTQNISMISQLEFSVEGLGQAFFNPYEFITASLYSSSNGEVGNGNEKGISTCRDNECYFTFENVDFGKTGSDEITIPIFALSGEPHYLQIWQGIPKEKDSELLADVVYQKPSIWNTYQPETYKLSKKLKGIQALSFASKQKMHIKGFSFTKTDTTFSYNNAGECLKVYGDKFAKLDTSINDIGNNVTVEFGEFDFSQKGTTSIIIKGNSPIPKNSIHLCFISEEGTNRELLEFTQTNGIEEKEFTFSKKQGKYSIAFVFLPGSNFNFEGFTFK